METLRLSCDRALMAFVFESHREGPCKFRPGQSRMVNNYAEEEQQANRNTICSFGFYVVDCAVGIMLEKESSQPS